MKLLVLRFLAFFIDILVISGGSLVLLALTFISSDVAYEWLQIAALVSFVVYFIVWESRGMGQTPGKQLMGVALLMRNGARLRFYESFMRLALVLVIPVCPGLISDLFAVYGSSGVDYWYLFLQLFLAILGMILWPISIILSGGRGGICDALVGTELKHWSQSDSGSSNELSRSRTLLPSFILASLLSLILAWPWSFFMHGLSRNFGLSEREVDTATFHRFIVDTFALSRSMNEVGRYFRGHLQVEPVLWTEDIADRYSFSENLNGLGDALDFKKAKPVGIVRYRIHTNVQGLLSGDFQRAIAMQIGFMTTAPEYPLEFIFVSRRRLGFFAVEVNKRLVGVWLLSDGPGGKLGQLIVAEPDTSTEFSYEFQFLGWQSIEESRTW